MVDRPAGARNGHSERGLAGEASPNLPDLPITYGDYAAWQRELVASDGLAPEIAYWTRALDGLEFFELPTDFPRSSVQGSSGAIQSQLLDRT